MNTKVKSSWPKYGAVLLFCLLVLTAFSDEQKRSPDPIKITGYDIYEQKLRGPMTVMDVHGAKRTYTKVYVVELKGEFGEPSAIPLDIFIGDYKIPEYGGSKEGIYFKIYDKKLLEQLEKKPFGYGYQNQKIKTLGLMFKPGMLKPFKMFKEKDSR
jgi:hypothetical protein